jgi:hypothetical protein
MPFGKREAREGRKEMSWMLVFFVVGLSSSNSAVTTVVIPMSTEKLCKEAMSKLKKVYEEHRPFTTASQVNVFK